MNFVKPVFVALPQNGRDVLVAPTLVSKISGRDDGKTELLFDGRVEVFDKDAEYVTERIMAALQWAHEATVEQMIELALAYGRGEERKRRDVN